LFLHRGKYDEIAAGSKKPKTTGNITTKTQRGITKITKIMREPGIINASEQLSREK
jgi:hypothetical protein